MRVHVFFILLFVSHKRYVNKIENMSQRFSFTQTDTRKSVLICKTILFNNEAWTTRLGLPVIVGQLEEVGLL